MPSVTSQHSRNNSISAGPYVGGRRRVRLTGDWSDGGFLSSVSAYFRV
jgi:hypothetical protein